MKIGIITLYQDSNNYGGVFQAYALQKYLEELGNDAYQISYKRAQIIPQNSFWEKVKNYGIKYCIRRAYEIPVSRFRKQKDNEIIQKYASSVALREEKFKEFRNMIPHTKEYNDTTLEELNEIFDIFIAGSDQIWNPDYWSDAFFLSFVNEDKRKIAVAASMGVDAVHKSHKGYIKARLQDFDSITVREMSSKLILNKIVSKNIEVILDPTLMLSRGEWEKIEKEYQVNESKYIFCYLLGKEKKIYKKIKSISRKLGLPIVYLSFSQPNYYQEEELFGDIKLYDVGPEEFIYLLQKSEYVITDSFHGTVFSVIFNKKFWTFPRYYLGYKKSSARIITLLESLGISERFISVWSAKKWDLDIDWKAVNAAREHEVNLTKNVVKGIIS